MGKYVVVTWPDSQDLMTKAGFRENSYLINDDKGIEDFGSSAYFVDEDWLNNADNKPSDAEKARYCEQTYFDVKATFENGEKGEFENPFNLSDGKIAVGFYLDEGNENIEVILVGDEDTALKKLDEIEEEEDYWVVSFFGLPLEDRVEIAKVIDDGEYC